MGSGGDSHGDLGGVRRCSGLTSGRLLLQAELQRLRSEEEVVLGGQEKERLLEALRALERDLTENQVELQSLQVRGHSVAAQNLHPGLKSDMGDGELRAG